MQTFTEWLAVRDPEFLEEGRFKKTGEKITQGISNFGSALTRLSRYGILGGSLLSPPSTAITEPDKAVDPMPAIEKSTRDRDFEQELSNAEDIIPYSQERRRRKKIHSGIMTFPPTPMQKI